MNEPGVIIIIMFLPKLIHYSRVLMEEKGGYCHAGWGVRFRWIKNERRGAVPARQLRMALSTPLPRVKPKRG